MKADKIVKVLKDEIKRTIGCTDPVAIGFATAVAVNTLNDIPDIIHVYLSENIYKNAVSVGIPGIKKRGIKYAVALGSNLKDNADKKLEIFEEVSSDIIEKAEDIIKKDIIHIHIYDEPEDPLFIKIAAKKSENLAEVILKNDYDNISNIYYNNNCILQKDEYTKKIKLYNEIKNFKIEDIINTIKTIEIKNLEFLLKMAYINKNSYYKIKENFNVFFIPEGNDNIYKKMEKAKSLAKNYTYALTLSRMQGEKIPITAISGSGNHGITNFSGVLAVAEVLESEEEEIIRALAISSIITIYIKSNIKRMTAFCGCSVAASAGVAAGTVSLLNGKYDGMVDSINALLASLAGVICDGAKESCAYKVSTGVEKAIELGFMAKEKKLNKIQNLGIISNNLEDTFKNLGTLNNPGMLETDKCIVNIIKNKRN